MNRHRSGVAVVLLLLLSVVAACSHGGSHDSANPPSPDPRQTAAEYRFGRSPEPNADVDYQKDVVLIGGGAESIRSLAADGMTWTVDGHAEGAKKLRPGMVMFATNQAVGRVLGVRKSGGDVAVTLGPITVTDLVRRADLHFSGPLDLSQVIATIGPRGSGGPAPLGPGPNGAPAVEPTTTLAPPPTATSVPGGAAEGPSSLSGSSNGWTAVPGATSLLGAGRLGAALGAPSAAQPVAPLGTMPPSAPGFPSVPIDDFKTYPLNGSNGFGYEIKYDKNGTKVFGNVKLYADAPKLGFDLVVRPTGVQTAKVSLTGLVGITFDFQAGSARGINGNVHYVLPLPVDFHIPLYALGLPLPVDAHFTQVLLLNSAFSAKDATITFGGDYAFGGRISFGYDRGRSGITEAPAGVQVRKSLVQSIKGTSVGINSFVLGHGFRVLVGMGLGGFSFGPYVQLNNTLSLVNGSDLAIVKCRGATYRMDLGFGIGYSLPKVVASIINFFLHAVHLRQIPASGGTVPSTVHLFEKKGVFPKVNACQGAA